jgi:hypothetical protein
MKNITSFIFGAIGIFLLKAMLVDPVVAGSPNPKMGGRFQASETKIK